MVSYSFYCKKCKTKTFEELGMANNKCSGTGNSKRFLYKHITECGNENIGIISDGGIEEIDYMDFKEE